MAKKRKPGKKAKKKPPFHAEMKAMKRTWLTTLNARYVFRLKEQAVRIHKKFEKRGLKSFDARFLAELHTAMFSFRTAKEMMAAKGLETLDGLAKDYVSWLNHPAQQSLKSAGFQEREIAFVNYLEAKLNFEKVNLNPKIYQERNERAGITGQTYLDARVNLEQFHKLQKGESKRRPGKGSPLWEKRAVDFFINRIRDFIARMPRDIRVRTVKEMRKLVHESTTHKIEELKDLLEEYEGGLSPDEEIRVAGGLEAREKYKAYFEEIRVMGELRAREKYRAYLLQLISEHADRLNLKW